MANKVRLKRELFERDGWQDEEDNWWAHCSFGCGDVLSYKQGSLDRFPVMGQNGGRYVIENLRIACRPCNSANRNHKKIPHRKLRKKAKQQAKLIAEAPELLSFRPPEYTQEVKRKLKQNYPTAEGRDVNGIIRMDF